MSLIVHTIIKSCIIAASDTRTTIKDGNGNVRYDDTASKIVPFPNRVVVSHCGDNFLTDNLSVTDFLIDLRNRVGDVETIRSLPLTILSEILKKNTENPDIIFLISGYDEVCNYTYRVTTKSKEITLVCNPFQYCAVYNGQTDIAHKFMCGVDYNTLSFHEGILLTKICVESVISSFRFRPLQSVGGTVALYVLGRLARPTGWFTDGNIVDNPISLKKEPRMDIEQHSDDKSSVAQSENINFE